MLSKKKNFDLHVFPSKESPEIRPTTMSSILSTSDLRSSCRHGIGIDLGTIFCRVAVTFRTGAGTVQVENVPCEPGGALRSPSTVAFTELERVFGEAAEAQAARNPLDTVTEVVRLLGRKFHDPEVQKWRKLLWPQLACGPRGEPRLRVVCAGREMCLSPEVIVSMLIERLVRYADKHLERLGQIHGDPTVGEDGPHQSGSDKVGSVDGAPPAAAPPREIFVSVPGGAGHTVCAALRDVGRILGLEIRPVRDMKAFALQFLTDPPAAPPPVGDDVAWLHVDVGASGFRVAMCSTDADADGGIPDGGGGEVLYFEGGSSDGLHLRLMEHCLAEIRADATAPAGLSVLDDPRVLRRIRQRCIAATQNILSSAALSVPATPAPGEDGRRFRDVTIGISALLPNYDFSRTLSREVVDNLVQSDIDAVSRSIRSVLCQDRKGMDFGNELRYVVMTGTARDGERIPGLADAVSKILAEEVPRARPHFHYAPKNSLAQGCAILQAFLNGPGQCVKDVLCRSLAGVGLYVKRAGSTTFQQISHHSLDIPMRRVARRGLKNSVVVRCPVKAVAQRTRQVLEIYEGFDDKNCRLLRRLCLEDLPAVEVGGERSLTVHASLDDVYNEPYGGVIRVRVGDYDYDADAELLEYFLSPEEEERCVLIAEFSLKNRLLAESREFQEHLSLWWGLIGKLWRRDERIKSTCKERLAIEGKMVEMLPEEIVNSVFEEYIGVV